MNRTGSNLRLYLRASLPVLWAAAVLVAAAAGKPRRALPPGVKKMVKVYKTIGGVSLKIHIFEPARRGTRKPLPAIVFFFGGGWVQGGPGQFFHHCEHLAAEGMVAMSAEYRVRNRNGTTPYECVKDGKSAIRWVRRHAAELGVDPHRIAAGGGSAGGHVAACTAVIEDHEEAGEDLSVPSVPDALILFNPVLDTTKKGFGWRRFPPGKDTELSPCHHVRPGLPPTLIFHGTADTTVPFENVRRFQRLMREAGNICEVVPFEGKKHGFFNYGRGRDHASYNATIREMDAFLRRLGWLPPAPEKP